ncbi:hypothetical protein RJ641_027312 [Dillenia turbinata]|uniref:Uncharacterized protein n=1 Tax=Dillenia turbinata TaxID=194707 RepID=A0AAN8VY17_9MAGN
MADGTDDVMNLDLNLVLWFLPSNETEPQPAILSGESINLKDWIDEPSGSTEAPCRCHEADKAAGSAEGNAKGAECSRASWDEVVDLTHIGTPSPEPVETRSDEHSIENISLTTQIANQEQPPPVEDRDSVSSIAAGIHSESQTMDTAVEIDSMFTVLDVKSANIGMGGNGRPVNDNALVSDHRPKKEDLGNQTPLVKY